jgi:hypothetical protein
MSPPDVSAALPEGAPVPAALLPSVARHQQNLTELVASLRRAGVAPEVIDAGVRELVDGYRDELLAAVHGLLGPGARP